MGKDCGITSGKWMVRATPDDEAAVWGAVARAVYVQVCRWLRRCGGTCGSIVTSAQLSAQAWQHFRTCSQAEGFLLTCPVAQGLCASAKISAGPQGGRPHQQAGQRVICIYTDDFSDK